jgi:glutamate racemase
MVAEKYLAPLRGEKIDTLVLGCTHYPLLKKVIAGTIGEEVNLVDSAEATAEETSNLLARENISNQSEKQGSYRFYVTDAAKRFHRIAENILGEPLPHLDAVEVWGHDRLETKYP